MDERALLKKLRGHLAYSKRMEPYQVFRDEELESLLERRPKTLEELSKIKGFPAEGARVTKYGEAIIAIFNKPAEISDFKVHLDAEGDPVAEVVLQKLSFFSK